MDNTNDAIEELFQRAAAQSQLSELLDGKTVEEQHGIMIGVLCNVVGRLAEQDGTLAEQHKTMAAMLKQAVDLVAHLDRRVKELEQRVERTERGVRGPFIRRE